MAFMKESARSLRIYLVLIGFVGFFSDIGTYTDYQNQHGDIALLPKLIIFADIAVCFAYVVVGIGLEKWLANRSRVPFYLLYANLVVVASLLIVSPAAIGHLIATILITIYIHRNLTRLSAVNFAEIR